MARAKLKGSSFKRLATIIVAGLLLIGGAELWAAGASKKDMVVMAWQIDELITFDPAEVYELAGMEMMANIYDRLVYLPSDKIDAPQPGLAESWKVSADGQTFTFAIRKGAKFHSGNPVTAEDVAWSVQRAIKLNKGPAFILGELGLTPENVDQLAKATDPYTFTLTITKKLAQSFVINCLGSGVGSVVDKKEVEPKAAGGDFGNAYLKKADAGSGPFKLTTWKPNELVLLDAFPGYWRGAPSIKRVALKHVPESATQRLMLEKGDADVARNLGPEDIAALSANKDVKIRNVAQGAIYYLGLNQKNPNLAKPEVREALKWLVDYKGIEQSVLKGTRVVHQSFLPAGVLGAIDSNPYSLDVAKAKALLAKAGLPKGFKVTMDVTNSFPTNVIAQAIQADLAKAGIELEIIPGDNKQTLTKYRARNHDIYIGRWSPDYADPHSNTQGFAWNPDNSDSSTSKLLAWRNSWDIPEMTKKAEAALVEGDTAKRAKMYKDMQLEHQKTSPFVIMYQDIWVIAERGGVTGFEVGPSSDYVYYRNISIK
jgi:peptide/nickel transport system substrate-binding protein